MKVNDIIFGLGVLEMEWHEGLWACVCKGVEVKRVNGNGKSFVCEGDEKSWDIEPNETNSGLETLNQKNKSSLEMLNQRT